MGLFWPVVLRDGTKAVLLGRSPGGRILVGQGAGKPMSWHISGRWRWDDQTHPKDIVEGLPDPPPTDRVIWQNREKF